ncbi:MAG: transporter [Steroidobacteraceae bacterium]
MFTLLLLMPLVQWLPAIAGPPFQTDDPEPVDLGHYEFYVFSGSDGTPLETDPVGPALEFNWGSLPDLQLHAVMGLGAVVPDAGPSAYGLLDTQLGIKYRLLSQTAYRPDIGIFPMVELPTGSRARGLGIGKTWYKLPIWMQKDFGAWTTYGGGGYEIVRQVGYRSFAYEGWLLQRDVGEKWTLGGEIFHHAAEGLATAQTSPATMLDVGGYYYFDKPAFQLLFAIGHTVVGQPEIYSYLGLYWTWGGKPQSGALAAPTAVGRAQAARLPVSGPTP